MLDIIQLWKPAMQFSVCFSTSNIHVHFLQRLVMIFKACFWSSGWSYVRLINLCLNSSCYRMFFSAASEADVSGKVRCTAQPHVWKCAFLCLLMSDQLHNVQPHPSDGQEAAVRPITWSNGLLIITSFPSFVTLSCFSALSYGFPLCIFNIYIYLKDLQECQGQRWINGKNRRD